MDGRRRGHALGNIKLLVLIRISEFVEQALLAALFHKTLIALLINELHRPDVTFDICPECPQ